MYKNSLEFPFDDIGTAEVLVTAANAKLADLKNKLIENNENLNRLRKKQKKWMIEINIFWTLSFVFMKIL